MGSSAGLAEKARIRMACDGRTPSRGRLALASAYRRNAGLIDLSIIRGYAAGAVTITV
jgi:hypothetical protein